MLRFSKISLVVLFCGVAVLVVPPAVHAEPEILIIASDGTTQLVQGQNGMVNFSGTLGPFTVRVKGKSNAGSNATKGDLELMATVSGGGLGDSLTILLTDINFMQNGPATFADKVEGTITGPGSVTFNAFLDSSNTAFGITGATVTSLSPLGPFTDPRKPPDASYSGSSSTTVTDTSPSSTTSESQVTGGDVSFTLVVKNTPTK